MKKILSILFVLMAFGSFSQNQFHIGQYAVHQPFLNPASIGSMNEINMALLYKTQWVRFEGAPKMGGFNFNMPLGKSQKSYMGLNFINDRIGLTSSNEISATYAYKLKTGEKSRLIFGLSASLNLIKADLADAFIIDAGDPIYSQNSPTFALPNFKFGSYFYKNSFYIGFVVPNILENKVIDDNGPAGEFSFNPKNIHYYLHGGYKWRVKGKHDVIFSTLIKEVSGAPLQVDINLNTMFKERFGLGISYRSSKELMLSMGIYLAPQLLLSYGYEYGFSNLNKFNVGSHEVLMVYRFNSTNATIAFPRL